MRDPGNEVGSGCFQSPPAHAVALYVCIQAGAYTKASIDQKYLYSPLDGTLVHLRVTPSIKLAGTHLYTWVETDTEIKVSCPKTQLNVQSPARARTRNARSGDARTNHETTAPSNCSLTAVLQNCSRVSPHATGAKTERKGENLCGEQILPQAPRDHLNHISYTPGFSSCHTKSQRFTLYHGNKEWPGTTGELNSVYHAA